MASASALASTESLKQVFMSLDLFIVVPSARQSIGT